MPVSPSPSPAQPSAAAPSVGAGAAGILGSIGKQAQPGQGAQSANPNDPAAAIGALAGIGGGGSGGQAALLGTGVAGTAKVDTSGLGSLAGAGTVVDATAAFDKLWQTDNQTFTYLQQQLQAGGFYGSGTPTYGVYSSADQLAFVAAAKTAAQSGANLQQYLATRAALGMANGTRALPSSVTVIAHPNKMNTDAALQDAAKSAIGSDAALDPMLLAKFHAVYDSAYVDGQRAAAKESAAAAAQANTTADSDVTAALMRQSSGSTIAADQATKDAGTIAAGQNGSLTPQGGLTADITQAPDVGVMAQQFLQANDQADVAAQKNALVTKGVYAALGGHGL